MTSDELMTSVTEVEMILNSRPVTYLLSDDAEEPLTPSHLLIGRRVLTLPDPTLDDDASLDDNLSRNDLTRRMRHLSKTVDDFWKRWRDEYLLELREAHRQFQSAGGSPTSIAMGDTVIVHEENHPMGLWRLGRVRELIQGVDGNVRGALVRVQSGGGHSTIRRPVQRLYPLEVREDVEESQENVPPDNDLANRSPEDSMSTMENVESSTQPRRQASTEAQRRGGGGGGV